MFKSKILPVLVCTVIGSLVLGIAPVFAQECPPEHEMVPVTIDIKPGGYPNPINPNSAGLTPVALLGSATFDVASVDTGTVTFHPMGRCEQAVPPKRLAFTDVNNDGYTDILFHFKTRDVGFQPGDTAACLHGTLLETGEHFCGHDDIVIVGR